ncbi:MAG: hypothetical protein ACQUHE_18195, partial [Bacteroidia bacterium]
MKNTLPLFLLTFLLSSSFSPTQAQQRALTLETKTNSNRSVDFNYQKTDPGSYTVVVNFTTLTNAYRPGSSFTASEYSGRLFSLTPTNKEQGIGFGYSVSYIRGKLKPKYDPNFIYLLPYKDEAKVQVSESTFLGATYFGDTTPDDWKSLRFYTTEQDSVTAIRKGVVVDIKDLHESLDESNVAYTSKTNELIIEHTDGTLATYRGFKKGSFAVKLGQTVFPGMALGLNSKYDKNGKYNVSIMVTYLKAADFENKSTSLSKGKSFYGFVNPHFITADNADEQLVSQKIYMAASTPD